MIVLLVIGSAWLALMLLVLGMLHAATSTPTPRPVSPTPLALTGERAAMAVPVRPGESAAWHDPQVPAEAA